MDEWDQNYSYKLLHTLLHQGLTKQMHILKNLHHRQFLNNCIWDILCEEEGQGSKRIYLSPLMMAWVWLLNLASKSVEFAVDFHPRPKDFSDGNSSETLRQWIQSHLSKLELLLTKSSLCFVYLTTGNCDNFLKVLITLKCSDWGIEILLALWLHTVSTSLF